MSVTPPEQIQRWMVEVITHTGPLMAALSSPAAAALVAPERAGELIRPTLELSSADRLGIYHGMYLLRMEEALAADFPALHARLDPARFSRLVADYVEAHPSRSYTLNRLGDALPAFLAARAASRAGEALAELARLERAITESFDAEASPTLPASTLAGLPPTAWATCRFHPQTALRLLCLRYDAGEQLDALHVGAPVRTPRRRWTRLVLFRHGDEVRRLTLARSEFAVLEALCAGATLAEALGRAGPRAADQVFLWFRAWLAAGLFSGVSPGDSPSDA